MFRKFSVFVLCLVFVCSVVPFSAAVSMPSQSVASAVANDTSTIYNDAKFEFQHKRLSDDRYEVTLKRRDHDFDAYAVQFIYNIVVRSGNQIIVVPKYVLLDPGQGEVKLTENAGGKVYHIREKGYGVKFPPIKEISGDTSLNDAAFNLKLQYAYHFFGNSNLDYELYRRDGKMTGCHIILKRAITVFTKEQPTSVDWAGFGLNSNETTVTGTIYDRDGFIGTQTRSDEYYFQFH